MLAKKYFYPQQNEASKFSTIKLFIEFYLEMKGVCQRPDFNICQDPI